MSKIAVIGTGIAGLSAAYLLNTRHEVTVYEKNARPGGHSRTITVQHGDRRIPVDTGFIVFNERNYPNLTALFRHLGVAVKKSDMTFALTVRDGWLEWGARDLKAIFAQRRNLVRPQFLKLFFEVMRFNAQVVDRVEREPDMTLGALIARMQMSDWFRTHYLLPMAGAIWSCPPRQMLALPARTFVRFFANHNLLSAGGQPQWLTLDGGAQTYVERMTNALTGKIRSSCGAAHVTRVRNGVEVQDANGDFETYDEVVFACHADEACALLADASHDEKAALGAFSYQRNLAVLHRDPMFMPKRRDCWASWVYHSDGRGEEPAITVTYWMNLLQSIDQRYPLFVTLNPSQPIPSAHVFDEHEFMHPVFDTAALQAQSALEAMQGNRHTWFCGAHLGHGFHEDGLVSALNVASGLGVTAPWPTPDQARAPVRSTAASTRPAYVPPIPVFGRERALDARLD